MQSNKDKPGNFNVLTCDYMYIFQLAQKGVSNAMPTIIVLSLIVLSTLTGILLTRNVWVRNTRQE